MDEILNLSALCRCCHVDGDFKSLQTPYQHRKTVEVYSVLLRETLGISINPPPCEASYSICDECIVRLRDAHRFRTQVLECEQKFLEYCQNEQFMSEVNEEIKNEVATDSDGDYGCDEGSNNDEKSYDVKTCEMELKIELPKCDDTVNELEKVDVKKEKSEKDRKCKVVKKETSNLKTIQTNKKTKKLKGIKKLYFEYLLKTDSGEQHICLKCGESCQERKDIRSHIREFHKSVYCCLECSESFKSCLLFKEHFAIHSKQYRCSVCKREFTGVTSLKTHLNAFHTKLVKYTCDLCKKEFVYRCLIIKHMQWHMRKKSNEFRNKKKLEMKLKVKKLKPPKHTFEYLLKTDSGDQYVCLKCGESSQNRDEIQKHITENHKSVFGCLECSEIFKSLRLFKEHCTIHSKQYTCSLCNKEFCSRSSLKNHLNSHTKMMKYTCDLCKKDFIYKTSLSKHMLWHMGKKKKWICDTCGKSFNDSCNLNIHKDSVHLKLRKYACKICSKKFTKKRGLVGHLLKHKGIKIHKCSLCPASFYSPRSLLTHKLKHKGAFNRPSEKPLKQFTCKICSIIFNNRSLLLTHMKTHRGTMPHLCSICGKDFSCPYSLKRHIESHSGVKRHECDICHAKFLHKNDIARHKKNVHEKEFPSEKIQCGICKVWVSDMKKHMHCHTDRPFACHLCEKNYSAQNGLNRHIQNEHLRRRVHKCNLCPKEFTHKSNFVRHKLRAHNVVHKEEENCD